MNIFITVGTTKFDSLIRMTYEYASQCDIHEFKFQIADGSFKPEGYEYFEFVDNIDFYYKWADVVITHAGAGSVYQLLEMKKKIIIVPNLDRVDKHQSDIANYMHSQGFALIAHNASDLHEVFLGLDTIKLRPYEKESFFMQKKLANYIKGVYEI